MATPFPSAVVHDAVADRREQALSFHWGPVEGATSYVCELDSVEGKLALNGTKTTATFFGLVPNRTYQFQISALLGVDGTAPSPAFVTSTTLPKPPVPLAAPMPGMQSATSISWDWSALVADRNVQITTSILRNDGSNTAPIYQSTAESGNFVDWTANGSISYRLELSCAKAHAPGGVNRALSAPVDAVVAPGAGVETLGRPTLPHLMAIHLIRTRGGM